MPRAASRRHSALAVLASLAVAACTTASCSNQAGGESRSVTGVYSAGGASVRLAFPAQPTKITNPASFQPIFPKHTVVIAWALGNMSALKVHSYELAIVEFAPGTPKSFITKEMTTYGGAASTTKYGSEALDEINFIPPDRYSGIVSFPIGRDLVIAVGYDAARAEVANFLSSLALLSPKV